MPYLQSMKAKAAYSTGEMAFLDLVYQAAGCNPFTERRSELDRLIVDSAAPVDADDRLSAAIEGVTVFVRRLEARGGADMRRCEARIRPRLRATLLFRLYHEYCEAFDRHITEQAVAGADPCEVPFAAECLARMDVHGFTTEEALRDFAAFFQLRRAFHFIQRGLVGSSPCMRELRARLWNNAFTFDFIRYQQLLWNRMEDFSTMLLGETGTGKGAAAAAIGRSGFIPFLSAKGRFAQSFTDIFIATNLSAYAESLIESELFGHRKGAFTGAIDHHEGVLGRCRPNGAIFLDEIGDLSIPVQIKLLRVLQDRVFSPVGGHEARRFDGRVIAATNKSVDELRATGRFRDDFFYRLCSDQVLLPTLRRRFEERPEELDELAAHILRRLCGGAAEGLLDEVIGRLKRSVGAQYAWPGNVRELEQAVRSVLLNGVYMPAQAATGQTPAPEAAALASALEAGGLSAHALLARYCRLLHDRCGNYGDVARRTGLDRRTVRKYVLETG
jgi:DNA-binding NtrC family response regulator